MDHRPSRTAISVPPCARTMPAARLLAPWPTSPRSRTTTRSAPEVFAKNEAQPPSVPAPTTTRSALSGRLIVLPRPRRVHVRPPLLQLPAPDGSLDLRGPLPDPVHAKLPPQPLHRLLAHVAAPSVDLHRSIDHPAGGLRAQKLHRRGQRVQVATRHRRPACLPPHPVQERLGRGDLGGHVRKHELDPLVLG